MNSPNIYVPKKLKDQFYSRPPIKTSLINDAVIITHVYSKSLIMTGLKIGSEIVKINGLPVKQYTEKNVLPTISSGTPQDKIVRLFTYQLLLGDKQKNISLVINLPNGQEKNIVINRSGYDDITYPDQFSFSLLENNTAYLKVGSFGSDQGAKLLEKNRERIFQSDGLIIDVRENGGGDTSYGVNILRYLTNNTIASGRSKVRNGSLHDMTQGSKMFKWYDLDNSGFRPTHEKIFKKPVAILTSAMTHSAAEDFVMLFKQMKRGFIIGEKTAGGTGQPFSFDLPGGGSARICIKRDTFANSKEFVGYGIEPDIEVKPNISSIVNGMDRVLNKALEVLK